MKSLENKVAIVTGAAQGIGKATAIKLLEAGAFVVLTDLNEAGQTLAQSLGERALFVSHDVRLRASWETVLEQTRTHFGEVDILVNNAGIVLQNPSPEEADAVFQHTYEVNQLGVYLGISCVAPSMKKKGGGAIINLSSTSGFRGKAGLMAYNATKFAVRGLTKSAALEYAADHIRVNSVHPGFIDTPMTRDHIDEVYRQKAIQDTPLKRAGTAEEVADMIVFLASPAASFSTGSEFIVDGGRLA